jgi:Sec-independent protein secretion pathway component TatC
MSEGIDIDELLDAPQMRLIRGFGAHLRGRARRLAGLFVLGLMIGYPMAGKLLEWVLVQPGLVPDGTTIITLQPLELVLLRLQMAGYLAIGFVIVALIHDAARYRDAIDVSELPELPLWRGLVAIGLAALLALAGLIYAWEILIPFLLEYLQADAESAGLTTTWHLQAWIGFLASLVLGSALAFQVPLIVLIVLRGGLVEREMLTQYRRHLWFASIVAAAVLSPPDPLSLALVAAPMIILFELALVVDSLIPESQ